MVLGYRYTISVQLTSMLFHAAILLSSHCPISSSAGGFIYAYIFQNDAQVEVFIHNNYHIAVAMIAYKQ